MIELPRDDVRGAVRAWLAEHLPAAWLEAGRRGGAAGVREVRTRDAYEAWYPVFAVSGLAVPTWPVAYHGLDVDVATARAIDDELRPFNLGRLNPLGLNNMAPALFAFGTEEQRARFLPPMVRNEEKWCQLFSEPGAGSDLASLATRAVRDGDVWRVTGQKVWTTWADRSDYGILLARTDADVPKRRGLTYFLCALDQPGVEVRPLRHMGGETEFNEVYLDDAIVPDDHRVGAAGDGWRVAAATLAGERQMVAGVGSGGVDRIGGRGTDALVAAGPAADAIARGRLAALVAEERIRGWTNLRARAAAGGPQSSVGKIHQGELNQRIQLMAVDALGPAGIAWEREMPLEARGMLRSRANTIEGGTTEVNKNVVGERVLGLPREPDPWQGAAWRDVPR